MAALVPKSVLDRGTAGAQQIQTTIQDALSSAGIRADGNATGVQKTIQDALQQAGLLSPDAASAQASPAHDETSGPDRLSTRLHGAEPTTRTARGTTTEHS